MNKKKEKETKKMICPICGEEMKEYDYAYDNKVYGKKYYKCEVCGHKMKIGRASCRERV